VLIRPEQAEAAKGKNVVIGEECTITAKEKILPREVVVEKTADGKESLKITIKAPIHRGQAQAKIAEEMVKQPEALKPVRPVQPGGAHHWSDWFPIPIRPAFESLDGRELLSRRV
jgi:hypothetical protein